MATKSLQRADFQRRRPDSSAPSRCRHAARIVDNGAGSCRVGASKSIMSISSVARAACIGLLTAAFLGTLGSDRASASVITFQGQPLGNSNVEFTYDGTGPFFGEYVAYAGELQWGWVGTPPSGYSPTFYAYCADIFNEVAPQNGTQDVSINATSALVVSGVSNAGDKAAWLFNSFASTVHANQIPDEAAALQVAIWEALYDNRDVGLGNNSGNIGTNLDLSTGHFQLLTGGDIATKATEFLSQLYSVTGGYHTGPGTWLDSATAYDADHDVFGFGQSLVLQAVPEPGTLLLFGTGLVGIARLVRRRTLRRA